MATTTDASTTNTVTKNPIKLMDWQSELGKGNTDATTRDVKDNELAVNQLNDITQSGSKYIENAKTNARVASADRGMLMSSVAAGAGSRAAIDAAMPLAQQSAEAYGTAARDNQQAVNTDKLADQSMHGNLVGQQVGIQANLDEAERGREFTNQQNEIGRDYTTAEREASQGWQSGENSLNREHEQLKEQQSQAWQSYENALQRNFQGTESEKALLQQRFQQFDQSMQTFNNQLMSTLSSIYSNPNLSAAQQTAAANNARALHQSLYSSYAASMSAGVPEIYWDPYQKSTAAPAASGAAAAPQAQPVQQPSASPLAQQPVTSPGSSGGGSPWRNMGPRLMEQER